MTTGQQLEYQKLTQEIRECDTRQMEILAFIFTASIGLIGFGSSGKHPLIYLVPLLIIAPAQLLILHRVQMIGRAAAYIRCFLETVPESPKFESRIIVFRNLPNRHYRSLVYNAQYSCVQVLAAVCLSLTLVAGNALERLVTSLVAAAWVAFGLYVRGLYCSFASGKGQDEYFQDWSAVQDRESSESDSDVPGGVRIPDLGRNAHGRAD